MVGCGSSSAGGSGQQGKNPACGFGAEPPPREAAGGSGMPGSQPPLVAAEIERTAMGLAGRFAGPSLENNSGGAAVLVEGNVVHQLSANGEPTIVSSSLKPVGDGDRLNGEGGMVEGGGAPLIGICSQVAAAEGSLGHARRVFDKMPQWQTAKKKGKSPLPYSSYFLGRHPLVGLAIWGAPARRGRPPAGQAWVGGPLRAPQGHITQAPMYTAEEGGHSSLRRGRFHAQGSIVERGQADQIPVRDLQIQHDKVPGQSNDAPRTHWLNGEEVPAECTPSLVDMISK